MIQNKPILHISCAIDDSFMFPLSVMIVSLLENNKLNNIKIHLFSANLSDENRLKLEKSVCSYNQQFQFYKLVKNDFEGLPTSDRISFATYYRIVMANTIEASVDKFLYLDADIIVVGDIQPFFNFNMDNHVIGAINDIAAIDWDMHLKHSIPEKYLYFNAGVLLVNRRNWNNINATQKVFDYLKNNIDLCDFHDQDGLNGALYDCRLNLPPMWNFQIGLYFINEDIVQKSYNDSRKNALLSPVIIHFNGIEKPWHQVSAHPYRKQFDHYACLIKNVTYSEKFQIRKFLKRHILYYFFGWVKLNKKYYYQTRPINSKTNK